MNKYFIIISILLPLVIIHGCKKDSIKLSNIKDVGLKVSFGNKKINSYLKSSSTMTYETPLNYFVALKSAKIKGTNGTSDIELFNKADLGSSFVFDYTDDNTVHSLLNDTKIPDGEFTGIEVEIYFLQMNISIATNTRGIERRNFRIYLSDDAETENGLHQSGDITQINNDVEIGWLLGEDPSLNMDPVSPRYIAYTYNGDSLSWYDFAGKYGKDYGPFGDLDFKDNAPHPIYNTIINFDYKDKNGSTLILDFNVNNCWQFEDKSGDGVFGTDDIDTLNPTKWNMALPQMTITLE